MTQIVLARQNVARSDVEKLAGNRLRNNWVRDIFAL
jgi:hypothetical protein